MNEEKFTGKAELYDKYRSGYPDELIEYLYQKARCDNVTDIGAGTGKFTRCLLKKPWKVTAVEPNADMRGVLSRLGGITVVNAPAENTGLPAHSFGLVTTAQAFHWFDEEKFKEECKRILTDNGYAAVIWNSFVNEGLAARQKEICRKFSIDPQFAQTGHAGGNEDSTDYLCNEFFSELDQVEFYGERIFDRESFIGEALSRSHSPRKDDPNYAPFREELISVFNEFSIGDKAAVKCKTKCYLGKLKITGGKK